jgi:hypothetical protein
MDRHPTTYLSFWSVELENLPTGVFSKRVLSTAEARHVLSAARASMALICVSRKDLGAPYETRARERHEELCKLLREHADIDVSLRDFFGLHCANPSCLAEVTSRSQLLVVNCHYALDVDHASDDVVEADQSADAYAECRQPWSLRMKLAPDSLQFHLLQQISAS